LESSPQLSTEQPREPILTLPGPLTAYVLLLAVIHLRVLLPVEWENWTIDVFGFIPKRYDSTLLSIEFPGGAGARVWTFVTYSLLHASFSHIAFNVLWLLPFGSALARRFGAFRFFLFMAVTAIAGAVAHLVTHEHAVAPMIGASASVSGAMAAAIRFAFVKGSFLSFSRGDADAAAKVPALSLSRALRNPRVLAFLGVWFGINIIFGLGSISIGTEGVSVAWQAHIGGFFAGLCCFRCSIRCRAPLRMLRMRHRKMHPGVPDHCLRRKPISFIITCNQTWRRHVLMPVLAERAATKATLNC